MSIKLAAANKKPRERSRGSKFRLQAMNDYMVGLCNTVTQFDEPSAEIDADFVVSYGLRNDVTGVSLTFIIIQPTLRRAELYS